MSVPLSYPGVYIQEVPSGVHTISGVATSIAAFVGRTRRGPVNEPTTVTSFADFERVFGGLWTESTLSYAVRDFFLNGGSQALIVRVYRAPATPADATGVATLTLGSGAGAWALTAANPGDWANNSLRARVDYHVRPLEPGEAADSLFNLTVRDGTTGEIETFRNVSITQGHPRQADLVVNNESRLVHASARPSGRPTASPNLDPGVDLWADASPARNYGPATGGDKGQVLTRTDLTQGTTASQKEGMYALLKADLFNLLCIPPHAAGGQIEPELMADAAAFCQNRRAIFLVDPPTGWPDTATARGNVEAIRTAIGGPRRNAALYFPALRQVDPLRDNQVGTFAPCGAVAGVIARTDATRGVWKAPAGLEASIAGLSGLATSLTDAENGQLNPLGVNCLRLMPGGGNVVWGARTLDGADMLASEWKYLPVRRLALFVEESLYRGTHWVVFEPNDEPLWAQIRLNVGAFMQDLFRQGAFAGTTARQAYSVLCDRTTTTPLDQERGIVNILVGFAPLRPAEFVVVRIQQLAAQAQA